MKLDRISVGLAVRTAREAVMLTAADLAKQVGITASSLSRTENGLRALELHEAAAIASVLGTSVQALLDLAQRLEETGIVKERKEATAELQRYISGTRTAALAALEQVRKELEHG
jgi:transcriptional regulator with XRE-family HTH domain